MVDYLENLIIQSQSDDLRTKSYPKDYKDLSLKVSFGMGSPAKVSWASVHDDETKLVKGMNCVYLYFKEHNTLILAYGIMEKVGIDDPWPSEIKNNYQTITEHFRVHLSSKPFRYGASYVYRAYEPEISGSQVIFKNQLDGKIVDESTLTNDLDELLEYYQDLIGKEIADEKPDFSQGLFYMEKQLEDFIIANWDNTELGEKFDLIFEEGELLSQQYQTDIGIIDILAKEKVTGDYVVIELKRNQTSDDTVGQLMRYMGWVKRHKNVERVKGLIIAGKYDKKLDYALEYVPIDVDVFLYNVTFQLNEFK